MRLLNDCCNRTEGCEGQLQKPIKAVLMVVCNDSQSQADMSDIMNNSNQYTTEVVKNRQFVVT